MAAVFGAKWQQDSEWKSAIRFESTLWNYSSIKPQGMFPSLGILAFADSHGLARQSCRYPVTTAFSESWEGRRIDKRKGKNGWFPHSSWVCIPFPILWTRTKKASACAFLFTSVLIHSSCYNKNTIDCVANKPWKLICHISGGGKVQVQDTDHFLVHTLLILCFVLSWWKGWGSSWRSPLWGC